MTFIFFAVLFWIFFRVVVVRAMNRAASNHFWWHLDSLNLNEAERAVIREHIDAVRKNRLGASNLNFKHPKNFTDIH